MRILAIIATAVAGLIGATWSSGMLGITLSSTTRIILTAVIALVGLIAAGVIAFLQKRDKERAQAWRR